MALAKQNVTNDKKKTQPKTQTVSVGGRDVNVKASEPKYQNNKPATKNTSNVSVGGRPLSNTQKNSTITSRKNTSTSVSNDTRSYNQPSVPKVDVSTRNDFSSDRDYERYLLDNKIDYTKGEARDYLKQKATESGTTSMRYMEGMRQRYKNQNDTQKVREMIGNGKVSKESAEEINNRYGAIIDENGNEVDFQKYQNDVNLVNTTAEDINRKIDKLNNDYTSGKIDYETMVAENDNLHRMWEENASMGERLNSYRTVQGFDYYDWALSQGKDVTDFEAYVENFNDTLPERLAQDYASSWWDTLNILPDTYNVLRQIADEDYDPSKDVIGSMSEKMRQTSMELKDYAYAGANPFDKWTTQCLGSLAPMINSMMIGSLTPFNPEVFTNVALGLQSGAETTRQRLAEGADPGIALMNGILHGTITGLVEGFNAGAITELITGTPSKWLASLGMFEFAGPDKVAKYIGATALSEGAEEVIETLADAFVDRVQNKIYGSIYGSTVEATEVNLGDLTNQFIMATVGTVALGGLSGVEIMIDSKKKYNSAINARAHFESVLGDPIATEEEVEIARKGITFINEQIRPYEENSQTAMAVELPEDYAKPAPTFREMMNNLANAIQPDVSAELTRAQQTLDYARELESNLQEALLERNAVMSASDFMKLDESTRHEYLELAKKMEENGRKAIFMDLGEGINGYNSPDGTIINVNQSRTIDVDELVKIDEKAFRDMLEKDPELIFEKAGADASAVASASHELTHFAEVSGQWNQLRDYVRERMGAKNFFLLQKRIGDIYKSRNINDADVEHEAVAYYVQKYMGNMEFLDRMASYNSSLFNRLATKAKNFFNEDTQVKMEMAFMDAFRSAQNNLTMASSPANSVGSLFQAIGMTIHKESETFNDDGTATTTFYAEDENGNKVRMITADMVENSPLGHMLEEARARGFIKDPRKQTEMVVEIYNSILRSQDPEMYWAVFGSIGFGRAHVGTSSWDVSRERHFSALTTNSDKQYGHTFDVTTICTKTQQLIDVASETMKRLNRGLTEDEIIDIVYKQVFEHGEPVPCPVCYVFSRWVGIGGVLENIKNFQEKYKGADIEDLRNRYEVLSAKVDEISAKRKISGSKSVEELRQQTDQEVVDRYEELFGKEIVDRMGGDKLSSAEREEFESLKKDLDILNDWAWLSRVVLDVKTKKGVKTVKINNDYLKIGDVPNDILFDLNKGEDFAKYPAWKYRASRGQRYGKIIAPYTDMVLGQTIMGFASPSSIKNLGKKRSPETNPILGDNKNALRRLYKKAIENARVQNLKNGSRAQTTSDFRFEYITDYILHFMQLQTIGSYGQTYTKVQEAVPVLCSVGFEVNMSLMPRGKGYKPAKEGDPYAYYVEGFEGVEDGWYTIDCSPVTGMNPDVAFYLRKQFDNAQTIMVGVNDVHMFLCKQDPRIDFIIPYHESGGSAQHYASMMNTVKEGTDLDEKDRIDYATVSNENEEDLKVLTEDQKYARELREKILTKGLENPTDQEIEFMKQGTGILWSLWNRFYVEGVDERCFDVDMGKDPALFPYEYWDETSTIDNADINGMRYVQYCHELGYRPKFESLSNGDGSGGYWKVLPDRSMYNVDGTSHIQKAINMDNFSSDFLYKNRIQEGIVQPQAERKGIQKGTPEYDQLREELLAKYGEAITDGIVTRMAMQENIPIDENNKRYKDLRGRVESKQFHRNKTLPIVEDVIKDIEAKTGGNLVEGGTAEDQQLARNILADYASSPGGQYSLGAINGLNNLRNYVNNHPGSEYEEIYKNIQERYEQAQRMSNPVSMSKEEIDQIFDKTGWLFDYVDGKWKGEFYDDKSINKIVKYVESVKGIGRKWSYLDTISKQPTLEQIVGEDSLLFIMYPRLRNVRLVVADRAPSSSEGRASGWWSSWSESIMIAKRTFAETRYYPATPLYSTGDLRFTLAHELQHVIQDEEGFEYGSFSEDHDDRAGEKEADKAGSTQMNENLRKVDKYGKMITDGEPSDTEVSEPVDDGDVEVDESEEGVDDTGENGELEPGDEMPEGEDTAGEDSADDSQEPADDLSPEEQGDNITDNIDDDGDEKEPASILRGGPEFKKNTWSDFIRWVKHRIGDHLDAVEELARKTKNRLIIAKADTAMNFRAIANNVILNGRYEMMKKNGQKTGDSLASILGLIPKDFQEDFEFYMYNYRNMDTTSMRERLGLEYLVKKYLENNPMYMPDGTRVTKEQLTQTLQEMEKTMEPDELENNPIYQAFSKFSEAKYVFGTPSIGYAESKKTVEEMEQKHPEFKAIAEKLWEYGRQDLAVLREYGIIDQDAYDTFLKETPHYVPIVRNTKGTARSLNEKFDGRYNIDPNKSIRRFKGSNIDMWSLEYALINHTYNVYRSALTNNLHQEIYNTLKPKKKGDAKPEGVEDIVSDNYTQVEKKDGTFRMYAYIDGRRRMVKIDENLYNSLTPRKMGMTVPAFATLSEIRRNLITSWNPVFYATNAIKDIQEALYNTKYPWRFIPNYGRAWAQIVSNGKYKQLYLRNGGAENSYMHEISKEVTELKPLKRATQGVLKQLKRVVQIGDAIELAPRLAEFISSVESGNTIEEAMYDSAEVTTNFKRGGELAKTINRNGVTFFNASVQGFNKQIRNWKDAGSNGAIGLLTYMARVSFISGIPLFVLNNLLWKDDDEYEELSDYIKENYYIIWKTGNRFIRIPKGRLASFYQTVMTQAKTVEDQVTLWNAFMKVIKSGIDNVAPNNPADNFLGSPLIQAFWSENGRTWYGEELVPSRLQKLPDAEQYDYSTDIISKFVGEKLNVSPYKINYVLDQYSGGIGDVGLPVFTLEATNGAESKYLSKLLAPIFGQEKGKAYADRVVSSLIAPTLDKFTTDPVMKKQCVSTFYELKDELEKLKNSKNATDEDILAYKYLSSVSSEMGDLYKSMRETQSDKNISNSEKYDSVRKTKELINMWAQKALLSYDSIDISGSYAEVGGVKYRVDSAGEWRKMSDETVKKIESYGLSKEQKGQYYENYYDIQSSREQVKANTPEGKNADYREVTIDKIRNSKMDSKTKNAMFDSYYSGKFTDAVNSMDLDDSTKLEVKYAKTLANSEKDENGKTVSGSKARAVADEYERLGVLDDIIDYINSNDIEPSVMGLSKAIVGGYSSGSSNSSSTRKTSPSSSKKSSSKSSSKSSGTSTSVSGGGSGIRKAGKLNKLGPVTSRSMIDDRKIANASSKYYSAYASVFNRSGKKPSTGGRSATVTCPNCGSNVSASAGRCPVCGANL